MLFQYQEEKVQKAEFQFLNMFMNITQLCIGLSCLLSNVFFPHTVVTCPECL